jgi:hypothetical protein
MRRLAALLVVAVLCLPAVADGTKFEFQCRTGATPRAILNLLENNTYVLTGVTGDGFEPDPEDPITGQGEYEFLGDNMVFKSGPLKTNFDAQGHWSSEGGSDKIAIVNHLGLMMSCASGA